jgi:signal transduction histidine kinase
VWHWNGDSNHTGQGMDHYMDHYNGSGTTPSTPHPSGHHSDHWTPSPGSGDSWDRHGSNWNGSNWNAPQGWHPATAPTGTLILAAAGPSPTPAPAPGAGAGAGTGSSLGPAQTIPIRVNGKVVGTAVVRLPQVSALPDAVAFRTDVMRALLLGGTLGAVVAFGLGLGFARRATRPVRDLTDAAQQLAAGHTPSRVSTSGSDEFATMGAAFNSMADTIEEEEQVRQDFAAEVAHELRTPLTVLRSQLEGFRVGVLTPDSEALDSLEEEVQRMSRLVADLQVLGSAEASGFSLHRTETDLAALVEDASRELAGPFAEAHVTLHTQLEPVSAAVDTDRIRQVLANLLSNALTFTPAGEQVTITLHDDGTCAVIEVCDTGSGIPAEELPHVFDRFFRGRDARPGGSGIGLAVVRELVAAHGGTVTAASEPGYGATFTVRLPSQPTPATQRHNRFHTVSS